MKKTLIICLLLCTCGISFAKAQSTVKQQFLLIVRFKKNFTPPSDTAVQANLKKWGAYMGGLAQAGSLAGGYRPGGDGAVITGKEKTISNNPYVANGELVSSVIIINANDMAEAKSIADKCPVFEFGGSVEIRPMMNTAGK